MLFLSFQRFMFFLVLSVGFSSAALAQNHFKKVVWIVFENETNDVVLKQPDFAKVAEAGVLLTNIVAETHPSQGNYISMIAGSTLGVSGDQNYDLKQTHIGDLLEKAGMDWRVYAENYPGNCFTGKSSGLYARKHIPFMSFTNISQNPTRCAKIESEARFFEDYKNKTLPEFSMYIPNLKNDGHNTGYDYAGKWLSATFGDLLSKPDALGDTLFIITFDESALKSSVNSIYTVLIGSNILAGSKNSQNLNHIALLKMIEDEFKLGNLGRSDATALALTGIWK
jgi:hypothetical protein